MKSVKATISGHVQGVWYRAWTKKKAEKLGLSGWVRNRADGSVEAVFAGPEAAVDNMLDAARQGPPLARVKKVQTVVCDAPEAGFRTLPTE